jgi:hypothetical protein
VNERVWAGWALSAIVASAGCAKATGNLVSSDAIGPVDIGPTDGGTDASDVGPKDVESGDIRPSDIERGDVFLPDTGGGTCTCTAAPNGGPQPTPGFSSAACMPPDQVAPQLCQSGLCGNGMIDTCTTCNGGPGGGPPPRCNSESEACDGTDLGGASCASLGFSSGTIRCSSACLFDPTSCIECTQDPALASCGEPSIASCAAFSVAVAVRMSEIGVAWITRGMPSAALHFARLDAHLAVFTESPAIPLAGDGFDVALASTPTGWVIAADDAPNLDVVSIDAMGNAAARVTIANASSPVFTSRTDGGPLLMWATSTSNGNAAVFASLLDAQAHEQWRAQAFSNTIQPGRGSAVYTGDGFLMAQRESGGTSQMDGIRTARVDLTGQVSGLTAPVGTLTEFPQLTWNGTTVTMIFGSFASQGVVEFAELDKMGNLVGTIAPLQGPEYEINRAVAVGAETLVLTFHVSPLLNMPGYDVYRVGAGGGLGTITPVARGPVGGNGYDVHHDGLAVLDTGDIVAVWLGYGSLSRIGVATIHPN